LHCKSSRDGLLRPQAILAVPTHFWRSGGDQDTFAFSKATSRPPTRSPGYSDRLFLTNSAAFYDMGRLRSTGNRVGSYIDALGDLMQYRHDADRGERQEGQFVPVEDHL